MLSGGGTYIYSLWDKILFNPLKRELNQRTYLTVSSYWLQYNILILYKDMIIDFMKIIMKHMFNHLYRCTVHSVVHLINTPTNAHIFI